MLDLTRHLLSLALESAAAVTLLEAALVWLRVENIIAPGITTIERLVWRVQRMARYRVYHRLTDLLSEDQKRSLGQLLTSGDTEDDDPDDPTSLAWLRRPGQKPSTQWMYHLLERLAFVQELDLPAPPKTVHPNYVRQLAHHCRAYTAQPLLTFPPRQREALLLAYLHELESDLVDAALDMFDRWFIYLLRQGRNAQKHHLYTHVTTLKRTLNTMTTALTAFLKAWIENLDSFETVFAVVDETDLKVTLTSA